MAPPSVRARKDFMAQQYGETGERLVAAREQIERASRRGGPQIVKGETHAHPR
jgi:hypothetical protein